MRAYASARILVEQMFIWSQWRAHCNIKKICGRAVRKLEPNLPVRILTSATPMLPSVTEL